MMDIYMTMLEKVVETGNLYYYLVNYDEYLELIFSNPLMGAGYIFSVATFVLLFVLTIPASVIGIKLFKELIEDIKELKTIE